MAQPHHLTRYHAALLSTSKRQLARTTRTIIPQCTRQFQHQTRPARRHPTPAYLTFSPLSRPTRRPYHSEHHPDPPPHEYTNSQTTILSAALRHVPTHGFTRDALTLAPAIAASWMSRKRRGLLRASVDNGLFEKDERVKAGLKLSVEEKTKILIMERLRMNTEIRHQWQDALALMSLAGNIPLSLSELHALSSEILTLAGDASVDASWYTKRLSVAAIYASSEVVMTRDQSPGLSETEAFVERRVEDSSAIGEKLTGFKQCLGFVGSTAIGLGRSWGLKI
ncbi:ubiquinone biosynthesis protein coq9 [Aspergillus bombycis]|uniref:Ubiquinone biosynthesis protein n=1 Tax=Aspergillus bombycis TaxID=109264 RepID=A0A1F7ZIG8_9EURO|nr:ubiquinone biosynthesis protein coq9 [Aspergillus bombycis]OGM39240.1 ubiquinone biosynthesis protein coq9 [Aspergillus bombycis]